MGVVPEPSPFFFHSRVAPLTKTFCGPVQNFPTDIAPAPRPGCPGPSPLPEPWPGAPPLANLPREHMSLGRAPQRLLIDHFVREGGRHPKEQTELFSCVMILCGHLRSGLAEALLRQTSRKSAQL
jgi:hypothetical protein